MKALWLVILVCLTAGWAYGQETDAAAVTEPVPRIDPLRDKQDQAAAATLVGAWQASVGDQFVNISFTEGRHVQLGPLHGTYRVQANQLHLTIDRGPDVPPQQVAYNYRIIGNELELSGGELTAPILFARQLVVSHYLANLFDITPEGLMRRVQRIVLILGIVLAARLIIAILRGLSHLLIFSERGPLALLFRSNKNRAKTVHALVLNLVKYFIYFTALGMILTELGVNYATYIASLSVIGLAIGFGSQGLVQDMVTGFFVIFEGQFDVGDMIEVSGQTGVVVELGLRMTKIRNYMGQIVVIPNRNIAIVGNFSRGAQRAYVDAAIASPASSIKALETLETLGREVQRQFEGVVLDPIRATGPLSLRSGEHFVRLHLSIWPGQIWVIDQQLIPRIRERFKAAEIDIPADRVSVFYHARQKELITLWKARLPWRRKKALAADIAAQAPEDGPVDVKDGCDMEPTRPQQ